MKKISITFLFVVAIALAATAQIQDRFFDMTIGKTTVTEASKILETNNFQESWSNGTVKEFLARGLSFANENWDQVTVQFFWDKSKQFVLHKITFYTAEYREVDDNGDFIDEKKVEQQEAYINEIANRVLNVIKKDYKNFKQDSYNDGDSFIVYNDKNVELVFCCGTRAGGFGFVPYGVSLEYEKFDNQ